RGRLRPRLAGQYGRPLRAAVAQLGDGQLAARCVEAVGARRRLALVVAAGENAELQAVARQQLPGPERFACRRRQEDLFRQRLDVEVPLTEATPDLPVTLATQWISPFSVARAFWLTMVFG